MPWNFANSRFVPLLAAVLGGSMFFFIHGYRILDPTFILWIQGDADAHFLGWQFFRSEPWTFPIGTVHSYLYPQGTSIVYSDSIPLVAIPLKLLSHILPPIFQYHGLWLLCCLLLQGYFAALLLRNLTSNTILILSGTIFFLLNPVPLDHAAGQEALASHWLILASLYLYFLEDSRITRSKWTVLLLAASLVHAYLLIMAFVIYFAYAFKLVLRERNKLLPVMGFSTTMLAAVLVTMWISGYFVIGLDDSSASGFTYHSMNLLQPFNPAPYESLFLKPFPLATEGQGFSYLGFGFLLLMAMAAYELTRHSDFAPRETLLPLMIAGLFLFAVSLSTKVTFGSHVLFELPLPFLAEKAAGIIRASHRMFIPVAYLLMLGTLAVIIKRNKPGTAALIIVACTGLQFADLLSYYKTIKLDDVTRESPLKSDSWSRILRNVAHIVLVPSLDGKKMARNEPFNSLNDHTPFAFLAAMNGKTLNVGYVARYDYKARNAYREHLLRDYQQGKIAPDSLYVIGEMEYLRDSNLLQANPATSPLMWGVLDGYAIIAPRTESADLEPWPVRPDQLRP